MTAAPTASARAQTTISGRNAATTPATAATVLGRETPSRATAIVASAVARPVSIPLAAHAPIGNARAMATSPAMASAACGRGRPRTIAPTRWPRKPPPSVQTATPSTFARTSAVSPSPLESGARSSAHGSGVTPSVEGPCASNR